MVRSTCQHPLSTKAVWQAGPDRPDGYLQASSASPVAGKGWPGGNLAVHEGFQDLRSHLSAECTPFEYAMKGSEGQPTRPIRRLLQDGPMTLVALTHLRLSLRLATCLTAMTTPTDGATMCMRNCLTWSPLLASKQKDWEKALLPCVLTSCQFIACACILQAEGLCRPVQWIAVCMCLQSHDNTASSTGGVI